MLVRCARAAELRDLLVRHGASVTSAEAGVLVLGPAAGAAVSLAWVAVALAGAAVLLRRLRALAQRWPRVVDACLAGFVAAVSVPVTMGGGGAPGVLEPGIGVTGAGWVWFAAVHVPLVWRRRGPVVVFWAVISPQSWQSAAIRAR